MTKRALAAPGSGYAGGMRLHRPLFALTLLGTWLVASLAVAASDVEQMREEARSLIHVQRVLAWYNWAQGERSIISESYVGHERLFSKESIARVRRAQRRRGLSPDERRALEFFKNYLVMEVVSQRTAPLHDAVQNAALSATAKLPWGAEPVPYKQLALMLKKEKDPDRRARLVQESARIRKDVLNPIHRRKEQVAQRVARELGYRSFVALSEDVRGFKLQELLAEGERFFLATDDIYRELLAEGVRRQLGMEVAQLGRRGDLLRLFNAPALERYFPKELMLPTFKHFLAGIGLDMRTVAGTEIYVDAALHPLKESRPMCDQLRTPGDVRISFKPTDGLHEFYLFFHEGGHALHFANTTTPVWEFQRLGPNASLEGFGDFFGLVWDDPLWLRRYRAFVVQYNEAHGTQYPVLTDAQIAEVVRIRALSDLYMLRRHAMAKLVYESVLHGGSPKLWRSVYTGSVTDPMAVYREMFSRAYSFSISEEELFDHLVDVDEMFYAADYSRGFALAHLMQEGLRQKFGGTSGDWYENQAVGALLKSLYAEGQKLQPDEVARVFGKEKLDLQPAQVRLARLLTSTSAAAPQ